jgi:hypothetical protein
MNGQRSKVINLLKTFFSVNSVQHLYKGWEPLIYKFASILFFFICTKQYKCKLEI